MDETDRPDPPVAEVAGVSRIYGGESSGISIRPRERDGVPIRVSAGRPGRVEEL